MRKTTLMMVMGLLAAWTLAAPVSADFAGQTILGPLSSGSIATGDTRFGSTDDNDGWFSGTHVFFIWEGPDDVYQLDWAGGDLQLDMTYDTAIGELDLFLYTPGSLDESSYDSLLGTGVDTISVAGAAAGTYYVLVDGAGTDAAPYELSVVPEPGTLALLGLGFAFFARRR